MKTAYDVEVLIKRLERVFKETKDTADPLEQSYFYGLLDALEWVKGERKWGVEDFTPTPRLLPIDK